MSEPYNTRDSLLAPHLPADYIDTYFQEIATVRTRKAEEYFEQLFMHLPSGVNMLLKVRDALVKPLGLSGGHFEERVATLIIESNDREVLFGIADTHLDFYGTVWCTETLRGIQIVGITTTVRFNNRLGSVYFFLIKPFHRLIVQRMLQRLKRNVTNR